MVRAEGLSDKTVEGILLNNDSEKDFDSGNNNKLSGSENQYEKVIQRWKILPMASGNATTMWKKQKVEEWKWNPSCSSPDKPTQTPSLGVCGINSKMRGCLS